MTDANGFNFRDWDIYKDARELRIGIVECAKGLPVDEKYALVDQIKRAMDSVILNIAEGSNKNTDKDKKLYMNRAQCSLDEVVACLDCSLDSGYIDASDHAQKLNTAGNLAKKLKGFTVYLAKSDYKR